MMPPYKPPEFNSSAFNCPYCGAYAKQEWIPLQSYFEDSFPDFDEPAGGMELALCAHCEQCSVWHEEKLVYPVSGTAPLPNPDLPAEIGDDYREARSIASQSPRGAAALLRLAIQKLCIHLGEDGQNLNTDIGNLVKKGLDSRVQKSLDVVRVVGNEAVHPGQIDLRDDVETAQGLFGLVNLITEVMISQPKHVDESFDALPESKREQIRKRDQQE